MKNTAYVERVSERALTKERRGLVEIDKSIPERYLQ